ncbi:MAG: hypothetical protein ABIO55_05730 [Ginsengibacter sp.]
MKKNSLAAGILICCFCQAQKNYDYTDTRKKNESFAKIIQKDIRADLASFTLAGISESIGKSEIKKIPFTSFGPDSMIFSGDNITARIKTTPFDPAKHKLDYDEKYLIKIDKKPYYGAYGSLPVTYISQVNLIIEKDTVTIPPAAYFDLYNLNLTYIDKDIKRTANGIYRSKDGRKIYLYLLCRDKTGSYEVTWVIQDKKYLRRVLDYGFM